MKMTMKTLMVCCFLFLLNVCTVVDVVAGVDLLTFNSTFGDNMVLQQSPAKACVYGTVNSKIGIVNVSLFNEDIGDLVENVEVKVEGLGWKACFKPMQAGGNYSVTSSFQQETATLQSVTFGDVWYCSGQSNMALPLVHTMSRNISANAILSGKYTNIRIFQIAGNMNPDMTWSTLLNALKSDAVQDNSLFMKFSSTCYYFGESLSDSMGSDAIPIGLIHVAFGGSTIEQWLDNSTISKCANATLSPSNGEWHETRVLPFTNMALKGFVWYQGENDMHGFFGNSILKTGYSCLMSNLISSWRDIFVSTSSNAPFGLVTLAPSGGEGGNDIGTMRWAQTMGYGALPNKVWPNVFSAQAFDLNDPYSNISCYHSVGCPSKPEPPTGWGSCTGYCDSIAGTNFYMGPIHPRDKKPVGARLAQAAMVVAYGNPGNPTGPTISSCFGDSAGSIEMTFDSDVNIKAYADGASKMHVLTNSSLFCMQTEGRGGTSTCIDDGSGKGLSFAADFDALGSTWIPVKVTSSADSPNSIVLDLSETNGTAFGIRYGWTGDCCSENPPTSAIK